MAKTKLNFRFHNPNTAEEIVGYIAKIFLEVNKTKLEHILQEHIEQICEEKKNIA